MWGVCFSRMLSLLWSFVTTLCSPNEDFGTMNERWNVDFWLTFQWFVAQIKYSHHRKVRRKQTSATRPLFGTNLHFGHLPQNFTLSSWLSALTNWLKWRFVPKRGRVANGWTHRITSHATIFCNHLAKLLQKIIASQKTNTSHRMLLSFVKTLQDDYKR